MSLCLSRCGDWHKVDGASVTKCAASKAPLQTVALQERIQLKSDIQRLPSAPLGQLVKLIRNQEPTLNSIPKDLEVDIEKVKPSSVRALQSFVATRLKENSVEDDSEFKSNEDEIGCVFNSRSIC